MKIHKAMVQAKREITSNSNSDMRHHSTKNAAGQISIKADLISEKIFLKTLNNEGLSGILYSEESGTIKFGKPDENDEHSLIIMLDPLDGSQNYVKGLPIGAISVGYGKYIDYPHLSDLDRGLVANLYRDDVLSCKRGGGSYYNGIKLDSDYIKQLNSPSPLIMSYYYYSKLLKNKNKINTTYSTRSLGSSTWELALVALGQSDAYIDIRGVLKAHDYCAVRLILEEMGGKFNMLSYGKYGSLENIPLDDFTTGYFVVAGTDTNLVDTLTNQVKEIVMID
jgi:fructose-1,6-bisphosphatase/inositol monophosphatase family enzyme